MRGSTAAGINNSLLPRDCSCGEFAGGHLLVVPSGERPLVSGICGEFACSAVWEEAFPLAFVGNLPLVLYWKRLLSPGICGIRHIRYRRGPPVVPNAFSVHENPLFLHRRRFQRNSVLKIGFYGTEGIFGARKPPPVVRGAFSSGAPGANLSHLNQGNTYKANCMAAVNTSLFSCRFMDVPI